jgi:GT2 family glycosyltransferase
MTDLCVMLPTRHRPEMARRCIDSFRETVSSPEVELTLVVDDDDHSYDEGFEGVHKATVTRGTLVTAINVAAAFLAPDFGALMLVADDMIFQTPGWDEKLLAALGEIGGTGIVGWDDKRRYDALEHVLMSTDIVRALGYFANPAMSHFYIDNAWTELGKRSGLLRYCPDVIIEHKHYSVDPETVRDEVYTAAETAHGGPDLAAFQQYRTDQLPLDVAMLRREFSRDVSWVLSRVA